MNEALLHVARGRIDDSRSSEQPAAPSPAYRFFGAALLVRASEHLPLGVRAILRWAESEAARTIGSGRATPGTDLVLGMRLAYGALRAEAAAVRGPAPDGEEHPSDPVLRSLAGVRHRQRAVLVLCHGLGLDAAGVAAVVGVRRTEVARILSRAEAAAAKAAHRPVDVARSLGKLGRPARPRRRAGPRPCPAGPPGKTWPRPRERAESPPEIVRMPRAVTRTLIAPPDPSVADAPGLAAGATARSPVEALIAPVGPVDVERAPEPSEPAPRAWRRSWSLLGRVAVAASIGILFAWAVWPTH